MTNGVSPISSVLRLAAASSFGFPRRVRKANDARIALKMNRYVSSRKKKMRMAGGRGERSGRSFLEEKPGETSFGPDKELTWRRGYCLDYVWTRTNKKKKKGKKAKVPFNLLSCDQEHLSLEIAKEGKEAAAVLRLMPDSVLLLSSRPPSPMKVLQLHVVQFVVGQLRGVPGRGDRGGAFGIGKGCFRVRRVNG